MVCVSIYIQDVVFSLFVWLNIIKNALITKHIEKTCTDKTMNQIESAGDTTQKYWTTVKKLFIIKV